MLRPCFHKKKKKKKSILDPLFSALHRTYPSEKKKNQKKKPKKKKPKKTVECPSQEHPLKSSTFHFTSHSSTLLNFAIVPEGELCVNVVIGKDWYVNGSPLYWKIDIF